ncbi:hypothetical protein [Nocardia sp. NPDC052112]|uniref:hypothetical protein n=1 Tax=Nocardia sp. NPDC052112 TaxID=3155646 RepID=UPI00341ADA11
MPRDPGSVGPDTDEPDSRPPVAGVDQVAVGDATSAWVSHGRSGHVNDCVPVALRGLEGVQRAELVSWSVLVEVAAAGGQALADVLADGVGGLSAAQAQERRESDDSAEPVGDS